MYACPALTVFFLPVLRAITATRPRPTSVTVPSQRSVVTNVAVPLAGAAVAAPPTARKTPLAVIDSDRTRVPLGGPLAVHGASAPFPLTSCARTGILRLRERLRLRRAWRIWKMPARKRASRRSWRLLRGRCPLTAAVSPTWPLRVSTVDPVGTVATPLRGMKPESWNGARREAVNALAVEPAGSLTNTSPDSSRTRVARPASIARVPDGSTSQASPTLSRSASPWPGFALSGQLSAVSVTPSASRSLGGGGLATVHVRVAGVASCVPHRSVAKTVNVCAPSTSPAYVLPVSHGSGAPPSSLHVNVVR